MLRILGGEFRSRIIASPIGDRTTRPMASRAKESIFNILRGWFEDANVLDLFAGVGTMGLEAVSRGARRVLMVEQNRQVYRILQQNIDSLNCADRAEAIQGDAFSPLVLARAPRPVQVVFVDPPYRMMVDDRERVRLLSRLGMLRPIMADTGFLVLRTPGMKRDVSLAVEGFDGPETHAYGSDMRVHFYMPRSS